MPASSLGPHPFIYHYVLYNLYSRALKWALGPYFTDNKTEAGSWGRHKAKVRVQGEELGCNSRSSWHPSRGVQLLPCQPPCLTNDQKGGGRARRGAAVGPRARSSPPQRRFPESSPGLQPRQLRRLGLQACCAHCLGVDWGGGSGTFTAHSQGPTPSIRELLRSKKLAQYVLCV